MDTWRSAAVLLLFLLVFALPAAADPSHPLSQITPTDSGLNMSNNDGATGHNISALPWVNPTGDTLNLGGDLDMRGGSLLTYFSTACPDGQAVQDVGDDGTFSCVSFSGAVSDTYVNETGDTMRGELDMDGHNISNLPDPIASSQPTSKGFADNEYVTRGGDSMTGKLDLLDNNITNLDTLDGYYDGSCGDGQAVKEVFDNGTVNCGDAGAGLPSTLEINNSAGSFDIDMNGQNISNLPDPIASSQPTSKGFADSEYLSRTGDSMSGDLDMLANDVKNVNSIGNGSNTLAVTSNVSFPGAATGNLSSEAGNLSVATGMQVYGAIWLPGGGTDEGGGLAAENLSLTLQEGNSAHQTSIDMNGQNISNLPDPISSAQPATKGFADSEYLTRGGDSMTGDLDMIGNLVKNVDALGNGTDRTIEMDPDGNVDVSNGYLNVSGTLQVGATNCAPGQALLGDGSCGETGGGGNLSVTLAKGNVANTTIDMGGNNLTDSTRGNVSIGQDLRVHGDVFWRGTGGGAAAENLSDTLNAGNEAGDSNIDMDGGTVTNITVGATQTLQFTGGNDVHVPNGNLGVGESSPAELLHVTDTSSRVKFIGESDPGTSDTTLLNVEGRWSGTGVGQIQFRSGADTTNKDDGHLVFSTASGGTLSEAMRINSTGEVGIGTRSPGEKFEVGDNDKSFVQARINGFLTLNSPSSNANAARLRWFNSDSHKYSLNYEGSGGQLELISPDIDGNGNTGNVWQISDAGDFSFDPGSNGVNVGIGTTSPGAKLVVSGQGSLSVDTSNVNGAASTRLDASRANNGGATNTDATLKFTTSGGSYTDWRIGIPGSVESTNQQAFKILEDGTTRVTVEPGGNMGVGTNDPSVKLDVNGHCQETDGACADVAELYPASEPIQAGELVAIDTAKADMAVEAAGSGEQPIGVVSTQPAILFNGSRQMIGGQDTFNPEEPPVALAGRVPVKVNLENGPIAPGDPVTVSSEEGVGMKAESSGMVVGTALESYTAESEDDKILVFVNPHRYVPDGTVKDLKAKNEQLKEQNQEQQQTIEELRQRQEQLAALVCEDHPDAEVCR